MPQRELRRHREGTAHLQQPSLRTRESHKSLIHTKSPKLLCVCAVRRIWSPSATRSRLQSRFGYWLK
ncbi:MAG: hypothetical protein RM368_01120 [Nostoc sp. DedSLP03]|uniref:hypothetical protein n=1 Tax=Nostoc sp. DedSLP03 TaxID=3075400 RepID=UPI002AD4015A|nr:hypothetical protein [Nostoc sp. DedSLP03]MDZ7963570.1 hypothetical protein [Nostoc sp. DedSLP03]